MGIQVQYVSEIDARLRELGFDLVRINGSHRIYRHAQTGRGIGYAPNESATKLTPDALRDLHRRLAQQGYESGWFPPARSRPAALVPCPPTPIMVTQDEQERDGTMNEQHNGHESLTSEHAADVSDTTNAAAASATPDGQKVCRKCGETKAFGEFYRDASRRDGLTSECKACRLERARRDTSRATQSVAVISVAPDAQPETAAPVVEAAPAGFTLADWLELHQATDGPSAFVTSEGFVILVLRPAPEHFEAWILTEDGSGPGQPVSPSLLDYVVRLLTGAGRDASRKLTGRVYY